MLAPPPFLSLLSPLTPRPFLSLALRRPEGGAAGLLRLEGCGFEPAAGGVWARALVLLAVLSLPFGGVWAREDGEDGFCTSVRGHPETGYLTSANSYALGKVSSGLAQKRTETIKLGEYANHM